MSATQQSSRFLAPSRLLLAACLLLTGSAHGQAHLRFAVVDTWPMPLVQYDKAGVLTDGIIKDLATAVSHELGQTPQFVVVSRKRADIALDRGWADVRCYVSQKWVADRSAYYWSGELFTVQNLLVWRKNSPALASLADLHGAVIGATLGYRYPALEPAFMQGLAKRDDAPGTDVALRKLLNGRDNYTVVDNLVLPYFIRHNADGIKLSAHGFDLDKDSIECAIARNPAIDAAKVIEAFEHVKQRGTLAKIMDKQQN